MSENVNVRMSRCWTRASRAEHPLGHTDQHEYEYFYIYLTWLEHGLQGVFFVFHLITNENIQLKKKRKKNWPLPLSGSKARQHSRQILTLSSDPSSQSGSPSQCHRFGTHWLFSHTKSEGEQVFATAGGQKEKHGVQWKWKPSRCVLFFFFFNIQTTSLWKERREATREVRVVSHTSRKSQWALLSHCLLLEMYSCLSSAGAQSDGALISRRRCHAEDTKATKCHWASARERERERRWRTLDYIIIEPKGHALF